MVGAKVEVLVTDKAGPAGLALALVRRVAGAVHTARVPFALVTPLALPPVAAPENKNRFESVITARCKALFTYQGMNGT